MIAAALLAGCLAAANGVGEPRDVIAPSLGQAPTSRAVAAAASYAATGTGAAMTVGFALLLATSALSLPPGSAVAGFSLAFLLLNFGPSVGDLLNGDVVRFGAHGGLRLLMVALSAVLPYALLGWVASIAIDLRDSGDAPARWLQRARLDGYGVPVVALDF